VEKDQRDLLLAFNDQSVRYLVVGGYALGQYAEPRATKDLDVFVEISEDNAARVFRALAQYGAPIAGLTPKDFQDPYTGYQFGLPPSQIDVIFAISAVSFDEAWQDSIEGSTGDGIPVRYISAEHFIRNKLVAGRLQDLADADAVQRAIEANTKAIEPANGV
jgi:hypothetical protein